MDLRAVFQSGPLDRRLDRRPELQIQIGRPQVVERRYEHRSPYRGRASSVEGVIQRVVERLDGGPGSAEAAVGVVAGHDEVDRA